MSETYIIYNVEESKSSGQCIMFFEDDEKEKDIFSMQEAYTYLTNHITNVDFFFQEEVISYYDFTYQQMVKMTTLEEVAFYLQEEFSKDLDVVNYCLISL